MSLEPKPAVPPRMLAPSSNPAQRLQELLRREAQEAQQARETPPAPPQELPVQETCLPDEPLPSSPATPSPPPFPAPPPVVSPHGEEPVTLIIVVNSERSTPTEYASLEEMPTIASLEETHRAFLLSDEWQRRGPSLLRIIRLRRRRR